jgi:hypothetical protein
MGGNTGNIRTSRISATGGTRTFTSLVADGASAGAGSCRRTIAWYTRNGTVQGAYKSVFDIEYGQFRNRTQWFLGGLV